MANVFFSYSHADEALRDQLEKQLSTLKRQGVIESWHDRRIGAGEELHGAISNHVEKDEIILLLVSPDFLDSDYCYDIEMKRAMERHEATQAVVIPVILRYCDWHGTPFGKLRATPTDGRPITSWPDRDQAFLNVALDIRKAAERVNAPPKIKGALPASPTFAESANAVTGIPHDMPVRSSNLRLAKQFSEMEMDQFRNDTFEHMARFFENSLAELSIRNEGIHGTFRRVDANRFTAVVYKGGKSVARGTVFMGGMYGRNAINWIAQETMESNSLNDSLTVGADDQTLYLTGMGFSQNSRDSAAKKSQEGAAEYFWELLIAPLQRN